MIGKFFGILSKLRLTLRSTIVSKTKVNVENPRNTEENSDGSENLELLRKVDFGLWFFHEKRREVYDSDMKK